MKVKKADDYQSWFIEESNEALLIDPWFDYALVDGNGWFLQRKKEKKSYLTEDEISQVRNIIITAPFEDHLHFNTLKEFLFGSKKLFSKLFISRILLLIIKTIIFLNNRQFFSWWIYSRPSV